MLHLFLVLMFFKCCNPEDCLKAKLVLNQYSKQIIASPEAKKSNYKVLPSDSCLFACLAETLKETDDENVQFLILKWLEENTSEDSCEILGIFLEKERSPMLFNQALITASKHSSCDLCNVLTESAQTPKTPEMTRALAGALASCSSEKSFATLQNLAINPSPLVRTEVAYALYRAFPLKSKPILESMLASEISPSVKLHIENILSEME